MATIRERLTDFALSQGFRTLSGFERDCGFQKNTLTKDFAGISSTTMERIVEHYPQLSLDWLILGRGPMLFGGGDNTPITPPSVNHDIHHNSTVNINYNALKDIIVEAIKEAKI